MALRFLLAVHDHQPVGNFEEVMAHCTETGYRPFLETARRHPGVRFALHISGPLLDYLEEHQTDLVDVVGEMVDRGQVEMIGGGFYEPILPVIPREDAVGQVRMMQERLRKRFGVEARGVWLAERVWEPNLPSILAEAGVRFTLLDDTQFLYAGVSQDDIHGWWITEDAGRPLAVFPIDMQLRYFIPFRPPEETLEYFRRTAERLGDGAITLGDDGEKFGVWPGTHDYVYGQGYLDRFFEMIESNADWLITARFDEELGRSAPRGRIYLPTASYEEMMEWVLPTPARRRFEKILADLKNDPPRFEELRPYLRGGTWRGFLAKYPESDRIHKRMLRLSRRLSALGDRAPQEARDALWQGQCNCAYWHGLFGGLYLGHLRDGILRPLARGERLAEEVEERPLPRVSEEDFDADGATEFLLRGRVFRVLVDPERGGSAVEFDVVGADVDLANVLARRAEAYHDQVAAASVVPREGDTPASIHELALAKEEGLERVIVHDPAPRFVFQERWLDPSVGPEAYERCDCSYLGIPDAPYPESGAFREPGTAGVRLNRKADLFVAEDGWRIALTKEFRMYDDGRLGVRWTMRNETEQTFEAVFCVDLNVTVLSPIGPMHWVGVDGRKAAPAERRAEEGVREVEIGDSLRGIAVRFLPSPEAGFWAFPVETVSSSESGFERTYQGSCLTFRWPVLLGPGDSAVREIVAADATGRAGEQ